MTRKWRIAGINFAHMHMGDNLRMVFEHAQAEIVGIADDNPDTMRDAQQNFNLSQEQVFTDYRNCLEKTRPDIVILCPPTAEHGTWIENIAPYDVHILMEKPFAATLAEADRALRAMAQTEKQLAINWPLAWYAPHVMVKELIDQGRIGKLLQVHFYDGNRGPLWHRADKVDVSAETVAREKPRSWFYQQAAGGGSLLDYLGYGTTLGTWYHNGQMPVEVTCTVDQPAGLEVDEHSITVARYESGLSKFETRWGTFTDPWTHQPQPQCGFVIVGTKGTLSSYDFAKTIRLQTEQDPGGSDLPVKPLSPPYQNPIQCVIDCIEHDRDIEGPLSPRISRIGQQIVDTAFQSAREKKTLPLIS